MSALSLIQGARKPFEECSAFSDDGSDDGSDEQGKANDSPWEISSISDDEDDDEDDYEGDDEKNDGDNEEYNNTRHPKTTKPSDTSPGTQLTITNSQEYSQMMLIFQTPNKEMPQLLESISFVINCLHQSPLRRNSLLDQIGPKNLSIDARLHHSSDLRYVKEMFSQLGPNVAIRISRMIAHHLLIHNPLPRKDIDSLESSYTRDESEPLLTKQVPGAGTARS